MLGPQLPEYSYRGARAMVLLLEEHLHEFLRTWRYARTVGAPLPPSTNPAYASLDVLLRHVFEAAREELLWICAKLELPDPGIAPVPELDTVAEAADAYLEHILECWRTPLAEVPPSRFFEPEYASDWGVLYCIDAMLEHVVLHPRRHTFQLRELLEQHTIHE